MCWVRYNGVVAFFRGGVEPVLFREGGIGTWSFFKLFRWFLFYDGHGPNVAISCVHGGVLVIIINQTHSFRVAHYIF